MAICSRCGRQTESAGEVCLSCSEYAAATSPVGAFSAAASLVGHSAARAYEGARPGRYVAAGADWHEPAEPEFASLPHFERPFAAEGTVWPDGPEIVLSPADAGAPDVDADRPGPGDPGQRDPDEPEPPERDLDEHRQEGPDRSLHEPVQRDPAQPLAAQPALPRLEGFPGSTGGQPQEPDQPTTLPRNGRWIALTAAMAVLLVAAGGAVALALRHDHVTANARINKPGVTATPSSSAPASVAPTGQKQLIVDQAAVTAPGEAAITATLNRYFDAINNHDYLIYKRTFIMALRGGISPASFSAGFETTSDSGEQLRSIKAMGRGQAAAFVTYVSQQASAARSGSPTCTAWTMEFFLGRRASRYLLLAPPLGYQAAAISCP